MAIESMFCPQCQRTVPTTHALETCFQAQFGPGRAQRLRISRRMERTPTHAHALALAIDALREMQKADRGHCSDEDPYTAAIDALAGVETLATDVLEIIE